MKYLDTAIPPPIVTMLIALAMWLGSSIGPFIQFNYFFSTTVSGALIVFGIVFTIMGNLEIIKANTTGTPLEPEKASTLVQNGVYQITRNPMYVGSAMILMAWAVHLSSVWMIFGVLGFITYINLFQIIPEEKALQKLFDSEYALYKSKVRRWL